MNRPDPRDWIDFAAGIALIVLAAWVAGWITR